MNIDDYKAMVAKQTEQPEKESKVEEPVKEETKIVEEETKTEEKKIETVEIDGKEISIDELKRGYQRQSDYTKKTTTLAREREKLAEAKKLYDAVQSNPDVRKSLQTNGVKGEAVDPSLERVKDLENKIASMELEAKITDLKHKFKDFDEVKVINEASKRGLTDLEFVYKALRDEKPVDEEAIRKQILEELKASESTNVPPSIVTGNGKRVERTSASEKLSKAELKVARNLGMTPGEYLKNK